MWVLSKNRPILVNLQQDVDCLWIQNRFWIYQWKNNNIHNNNHIINIKTHKCPLLPLPTSMLRFSAPWLFPRCLLHAPCSTAPSSSPQLCHGWTHCAPDNSPDYWPSWCRWQRGYSVTAALSSPSPCLQKSTQWLCGKQSLGSKRMQCVLKNSRRKCWSSQKAWWELQLKQNLLVDLFVGTSPFAFYPLLPEKCPSWSSLSLSSSFSLSF